MVMLTSCYYGVKGTLYTFAMSGQLPYYKKYVGVSGVQYQSLRLVSSLPWACKAWIGMISDVFPLFGYHKRYYIVGAAIMGTLSFTTLGVASFDASSAYAAALFFMLANLFIATADLLCEGKYAEKMMERPDTGSDLVSWVWGVYQFGVLTASCFIGPISDSETLGPKFMFLICVPFALQIVGPISLGFLSEEKATRGVKASMAKVAERPKIFALAFLTASSAVGLGVVVLNGSDAFKLGYAIVASAVLCAASTWALPPLLSRWCVPPSIPSLSLSHTHTHTHSNGTLTRCVLPWQPNTDPCCCSNLNPIYVCVRARVCVCAPAFLASLPCLPCLPSLN